MPTIEEMRAALKQDSVSQPSIEEMRANLKSEPQQALPQVTTGVSAFGGKMAMPGQKVTEKDLEALKSGMLNNAPTIGATAGEIFGGPIGAYGGAALGSAIKQYNNPPADFAGGAKELGKDVLLNAAIPQAVSAALSPAFKWLGNKAYRSAFKIPDQVAKEKGAVPLSNYFMEEKPVLSMGDIALENAKLGKNGSSEMRSVINEAAPIAPPIDQEAALGKALEKAQELKANPFTKEAGKTLEQQVLDYAANNAEGTSLSLGDAYKMSKETGKMASWAGRASEMPKAEVLQQARHGLESGVVNSLEHLNPQAAEDYMKAKQAAQTSIVSEPVLKREVGKAVRKNSVTEVKGYLGGHAANQYPTQHEKSLIPLALMYAAKLYNTPLGRTSTGKILTDVGEQMPLILKQSPWLMPQGEKK